MTAPPLKAVGSSRLVQSMNQLRQCLIERTLLESPGVRLNRTSQGVSPFFSDVAKRHKKAKDPEITEFIYKLDPNYWPMNTGQSKATILGTSPWPVQGTPASNPPHGTYQSVELPSGQWKLTISGYYSWTPGHLIEWLNGQTLENIGAGIFETYQMLIEITSSPTLVFRFIPAAHSQIWFQGQLL